MPEPTSSSSPRLSIHGVGLEFGGVQVLRNVSFDLAPSEVTALIGPNGAGKSALLNCISGIYRPSPGGRITLDGIHLDRLPPHRVAGAGVKRTFQSLHLSRELSVRENVLLGLVSSFTLGAFATLALPWRAIRQERENIRRADAVIEQCGLSALAAERCSELPLGVLRRVDLARALVSDPVLLLLDEPASGLSHDERPIIGQMVSLARSRKDLAVLWIEHDLELVLSEAERAIVLHHGELVHMGDPRDPRQRDQLISAYKTGGLKDNAEPDAVAA